MSAEFAASVDRWVEEIRAACGIPPAMVGRVGTPQVEAPQRSPEETLVSVDAAVEGRCAGPGCSATLTEGSPSRWWCSPDCQDAWNEQQVGRPSPGSAPVRGSDGVDASHMRWRPDLVTAFDDSGLELVRIEEVRGFTRRTYRWAGTDRWWFRLDDGHRFVGVDVAAEVVREWEGRDQVWSRLERELGDQRRLDPELREYLRAVPVAGPTVFWLPNRPADPEAPTAAELAGGVDLTPYLAPGSAPLGRVPEGQPVRPDLRGRRRVPAWLRRVESWLFPLAYCPVHGRARCGWPDWREVAAAHRGGPYRRRLRINLHVDARRFEEGMAQASEAFRRVGEQMSGAVGLGPVVAGPFAETYRRCIAEAVQTESDRLALRAVCTDGAMYRRALEAARERGWSARQMAEAVAAGRYTEDGWIELEYADGQRLESHVCQWEVSLETGCYRCGLHWSDGTRCESRTVDLTVTTRTERLVGPRATGDVS